MSASNSARTKCFSCGAGNRMGARYCTHCGASIVPDAYGEVYARARSGPTLGERIGAWCANEWKRLQNWYAGLPPRGRRVVIAVLAGSGLVLLAAGVAWQERVPLMLRMYGIEGVDLMNAQVDVTQTDCAMNGAVSTVSLANGTFGTANPSPYSFALLGKVRYGNVSGDTGKGKPPNAVFLATCGDNTEKYYVMFIYGAVGGRLAKLEALTIGDSLHNIEPNVRIEDGKIKLEQPVGASFGMPRAMTITTYTWSGDSLLLQGEITKPY